MKLTLGNFLPSCWVLSKPLAHANWLWRSSSRDRIWQLHIRPKKQVTLTHLVTKNKPVISQRKSQPVFFTSSPHFKASPLRSTTWPYKFTNCSTPWKRTWSANRFVFSQLSGCPTVNSPIGSFRFFFSGRYQHRARYNRVRSALLLLPKRQETRHRYLHFTYCNTIQSLRHYCRSRLLDNRWLSLILFRRAGKIIQLSSYLVIKMRCTLKISATVLTNGSPLIVVQTGLSQFVP